MFVLLEHSTADGVHWDFMIESPGGSALSTWRLARNPAAELAPVAARRIDDHPPHFLEYEGELREGRGRVRRVDCGAVILERYDQRELVAVLSGRVLAGRFAIQPNEKGDLMFSGCEVSVRPARRNAQ